MWLCNYDMGDGTIFANSRNRIHDEVEIGI